MCSTFAGEDIAGCFSLIVLLLLCGCLILAVPYLIIILCCRGRVHVKQNNSEIAANGHHRSVQLLNNIIISPKNKKGRVW